MKHVTIESELFTRAVEDIVIRDEFSQALSSGKQLRIKHGIDATSPDLHVGHAASLWKIRALQEVGHKAVILLGDYTTRIGDPTGRSKIRPVLSPIEIEKNVRSIEKQVKKILLGGARVLEMRRSSEWYGKMKLEKFFELLSVVTHARLIERDMFQKRMQENSEIHMHELIYPILQGYDSVMLKSDATIIGSDQLFNEHMGRFFQEKFGQRPQALIALKILPGLDGGEKMSKSHGNAILLSDSPTDKFGKTMRLLDALIIPYLEAYTDVPMETIREHDTAISRKENPMEAKLFLAEAIVRRYDGAKSARKEREKFMSLFSLRNTPADAPERAMRYGEWGVVDLIIELGCAASRSEARRLVAQGAAEIDGEVIRDPARTVTIFAGAFIRIGKRKFIQVK